jgi:hypothetical protein
LAVCTISPLPTGRARYREAGFVEVEAAIYAGMGSDGTQRDWIDLTVKKA